MPYKSKAQQAWMHIHLPKVAKRWDKHTSKRQFKKLPAYVKPPRAKRAAARGRKKR